MTEPVLSVALTPKDKDDELALAKALAFLSKSDGSVAFRIDSGTGKTRLLGIGEIHLDSVRRQLSQEFGIRAEFGKNEIYCRESITSRVREVATFIREQKGGRQFARCVLEIEPLPERCGFEFSNEAKPQILPAAYASAAERGIRRALLDGLDAGFPLTGIKATLVGGTVEAGSDELSFEIVGAMALRAGCRKANPVILYPIMKCEVSVPEKNLNAVIRDLRERKIGSIEVKGDDIKRVEFIAPLSGLLGYAEGVLAIASKTATFKMEPHRFVERP